MAEKYHINKKTGRPNVCHASVKSCPVGGKHYDSKEEARKGYETEQAQELLNEGLKKTKKTSAKPAEIKTSEETGLMLYGSKLSVYAKKEEMDRLLPHADAVHYYMNPTKLNEGMFRHDMVGDKYGGVGDAIEADHYYPGCAGCRPYDYEYEDYCRCGTYSGAVDKIDQEELVNAYLKNHINGFNYQTEKDPKYAPVKKAIYDVFEKHGLFETDNYEVRSEPDYYGDEITGYECSADIAGAMEDLQIAFNLGEANQDASI